MDRNPTCRVRPGQYLLIDADDTLWENNVYFERAIANFISFLNHHEYTPDQVREVLYDVERENIRQHGYGMQSFALALVKCFEQLSVGPLTPALHETIHGFAHAIAEHPMEILPEVPETLADLAHRHHLFLLTKGNFTEQSGKVERSGSEGTFHGCRSRGGERRCDLQSRGRKIQFAEGKHLDDRQQPEVRH